MQGQQLLRSIYADDKAIAGILPVFLGNIPKYTGNLVSAIKEQNWSAAARTCHDLKGTAGGYGYPEITLATARLEAELKGGQDSEVIRERLQDVLSLCDRASLALGSV